MSEESPFFNSPGSPPALPRKGLRRPGLLLTLLILGVQAGLGSAAFMSPGGGIIGWSLIPKAQCALCQAPKSVPTRTGAPLTFAGYAALLTQRLTLDQELGQMMVGQFAGQGVTPEAIEMLDTESISGVVLYASNIGSASQIRAMNAQLQQVASIPPLLAVDQEGGTVNRLLDLVGPLPGAGDLTDPQMAKARGEQDANWLHEFGFNFNLAPVVDVGTSNPQLVDRTFGSTPDRVISMASAYLDGLQAGGQVTGCLKHFPGLGDTTTDPHIGLPVLNRSLPELEQIDMQPYRVMLKTEHVRAIMVSHEMIPAVDAQLPTSLSPAVINGLLRKGLGYNGVVMTDSLSMDAISARWSTPDASLLAIEAGADVVSGLIGPQVIQQTKDTLEEAVASGKLTRQRIDASVQRILLLKLEMGLIPMPRS
ncbi:MAG TPA: glycoside hydrolase family 3 N-terminal domain-containing protein [Ktedonobacterales bacterium]|nr:glycoside hydrolase family 3 N-terminal domain-containing protein [Ktedonobacterales bacterium]